MNIYIYEKYLQRVKRNKKELPGLEQLQSGPETIEEIAKQVAKGFNVLEENLYKKKSPNAEARSVFMELSRRYLTRKLSITEIGGALGGVSISAISQNKRRLEVKRKKDKKLEKKFKKIELSLSKQ